MRRALRNLIIAFDHRGLTHFGGAYFFHEFLQVLQMRRFLSREVPYLRRNHRYSASQMLLALVYPIVLGLERIEAASFLRSNGTFQYLTGLLGFPDPQTLRRFLLNAPPSVWEHFHRANDQLLQKFIHLPERRSRLIFDLDSIVVTAFGKQDGASNGWQKASSPRSQPSPPWAAAENDHLHAGFKLQTCLHRRERLLCFCACTGPSHRLGAPARTG